MDLRAVFLDYHEDALRCKAAEKTTAPQQQNEAERRRGTVTECHHPIPHSPRHAISPHLILHLRPLQQCLIRHHPLRRIRLGTKEHTKRVNSVL